MDLTIPLRAFAYSGLLSLIGLALVLRYRASGIPDFSIATYVGLGVLVIASTVTYGGYMYIGPPLAFVAGCLAGWLQYRGVVGVMEKRGNGEILRALSTVGIMILGDALLYIGGYSLDTRPGEELHIFHALQMYDFKVQGLSGIFFVIPLVCVGVYAAMHLLVKRTNLARLTASQENPELAMVQGVDPWRVKTLVWVLSGGLAAMAGSLLPPFLHITPGYTSAILVAVMAVGLLGGFYFLTHTVVAGWMVGLFQMLGTLLGQLIIGVWFGEYMGLLPMMVIYFGLLLLPRGLADARKLYNEFREGRRAVKRSWLVASVVVVAILGLVSYTNTLHGAQMAAEAANWERVYNRIGVAGAKIYPDTPDPDLPSSMYFESLYPANMTLTVQTMGDFINIMQRAGVSVVYRHGDSLYMFTDRSLGYIYTPKDDNYGR